MSNPPPHFGQISERDFITGLTQQIIELACREEDIPLPEADEQFGMEDMPDPMARLNFSLSRFLGYGAPNETMEQDFKAIDFDFENVLTADNANTAIEGFSGLHTHSNGMVFYGLQAGGDWEWPVALIIYHDGMQFRSYIPQEGNAFNPATGTAYGSEDHVGAPRHQSAGQLDPSLRANAGVMMAEIDRAFRPRPSPPKI